MLSIASVQPASLSPHLIGPFAPALPAAQLSSERPPGLLLASVSLISFGFISEFIPGSANKPASLPSTYLTPSASSRVYLALILQHIYG